MDILNYSKLDPGASAHTRAVTTLVKERASLSRTAPDSLQEQLDRLGEEVVVLIGMVGRLHSAVCDLERKQRKNPS